MTSTAQTVRLESALCTVHHWGNGTATITRLWAKQRRRGHATRLMEHICEWADQNEIVLFLEVGRYGHPIGPDNEILEAFYKSFGFRDIYDTEDGSRMIGRRGNIILTRINVSPMSQKKHTL